MKHAESSTNGSIGAGLVPCRCPDNQYGNGWDRWGNGNSCDSGDDGDTSHNGRQYGNDRPDRNDNSRTRRDAGTATWNSGRNAIFYGGSGHNTRSNREYPDRNARPECRNDSERDHRHGYNHERSDFGRHRYE